MAKHKKRQKIEPEALSCLRDRETDRQSVIDWQADRQINKHKQKCNKKKIYIFLKKIVLIVPSQNFLSTTLRPIRTPRSINAATQFPSEEMKDDLSLFLERKRCEGVTVTHYKMYIQRRS